MKGIPLISSNRLIAEMFSDYNLTGTDWLNKSYRHIVRALELMQIDGYFELKVKDLELTNYQTILPCDRKYIVAVLSVTDKNVCKLPMNRAFDMGVDFQDLIYHDYASATVKGNYLTTNKLKEGCIRVIYYTVPECKDGYPMVPDNPFVLEAIPFFIIYKLGFSGYKHPMIKWNEALELWNINYPRARNDMNFPSLEEMQHFTEINTSPLYSNLLDISSIKDDEDTQITNPYLNFVKPFRSVDDIISE